MPIPSMKTTNKIEAASMTLPRAGYRIPGLLFRGGFVGEMRPIKLAVESTDAKRREPVPVV
jgi:hypothetical protein